MKSNHTPEPWDCHEGKIISEGTTIDHVLIANCNASYVLNPDQKDANARRIVECVNACSAFENPAEEIEKMQHMIGLQRKMIAAFFASPDKVIRCRWSHHVAQSYNVTPKIREEADWYEAVFGEYERAQPV